jgi:hypothetical protein
MAAGPDLVVPILRSGILARDFCDRVGFANVEAVFERCFYLRSGDDFVCIGEPDIGNGPITLIANPGSLATVRPLAGQVALVCDERITIANSVRFALDQSQPWRPSGWPTCASPNRLIDICATLALRVATDAPREGLARCVIDECETAGSAPPLGRIARPRVALLERWVSGLLDGRSTPAIASREAVRGLIGLGPGLTPSGDDLLIGALSALDAVGESEAHAAMARAIIDVLPGLTTPLSAGFLRAAAAGHVGENLCKILSLIMTGDIDAAIALAGKVGHSSGWDMIAGILTTLRIVAAPRWASAAHAVAFS